jgi:uncharacterized protein RhaS with RHS repeats
MIYMQQRYYDPEIGRFLSSDSVATRALGDNFNRYWYANNNPYTNTDPDGRECDGRGCWVTPQERAAAPRETGGHTIVWLAPEATDMLSAQVKLLETQVPRC